MGGVGEGAEKGYVAEVGDGLGVVGFGEIGGIGGGVNEDETGDGEVALLEGVDGEKGVVDGAESGAGGDEDGELEGVHEVEHGVLAVEGDEDTSGAFDEEGGGVGAEGLVGVGELFEGEGALFDFGGEVGGAGGLIAGGCHEVAKVGVGVDAAEVEGVVEIGDGLLAAGLGGFHGEGGVSAVVEGGEQAGGEGCFAGVGIGAGDKPSVHGVGLSVFWRW